MVSQWKVPKKPFILIETFAEFCKDKDVQLEIGGYGEQFNEMKELVNNLKILDKVRFLGKLDSFQIAEKMNKAIAFLHASDYETFSVVCAEALCSGCPVIASNVGGIREFVDEKKGILINENSNEEWLKALKIFNQAAFDRFAIAEEALVKFSSSEVGKKYFKVLCEITNDFKR